MSDNSISRREFLKIPIAAAGAALAEKLLPPSKIKVVSPPWNTVEQNGDKETVVFYGSDLAELQQLIDGTTRRNVEVLLSTDIDCKSPRKHEVLGIPIKDKEPNRNQLTVGVYIGEGGEGKGKRKFTFRSVKKEGVTIRTNSNIGILCEDTDLELDGIGFMGGKSADIQNDDEEDAYIFTRRSSVKVANIKIDGANDSVGKSSNDVDKGVTGIYLVDSKAEIDNSEFNNGSWDNITSNGSEVLINNCRMKGTHDKVNAGGAVGIIMGGSATIKDTEMRGRVKGVIMVSDGNLEINHSTIEAIWGGDCYAVIVGSDKASLKLTDSTLYSPGILLVSETSNVVVQNNVFNYVIEPHPGEAPKNLRGGRSSIELPVKFTDFTKNIIFCYKGISPYEVFSFDLSSQEALELSWNRFWNDDKNSIREI